jgi:hypothetical protein
MMELSQCFNAKGLDNFVQLMLTGYMMELNQCFNAKGLDNFVQLMLRGYVWRSVNALMLKGWKFCSVNDDGLYDGAHSML